MCHTEILQKYSFYINQLLCRYICESIFFFYLFFYIQFYIQKMMPGGVSDGQRTADNGKMPPPGSGRVDAESVGHLSQSGHLVMGPGARRDTATGMSRINR